MAAIFFIHLRLFLFIGLISSCVAQGIKPAACRGLNGEVCLAWINGQGLCFQRLVNGDKSHPNYFKEINPVKNGEQYVVSGVTIKGLPAIACDTGTSMFRGRIYICWSDEKYGAKNKDVFLVYSDDRGDTWTEPILVTYRPNHKEQFKPALSVDRLSGRLSLVYYDRQNYTTGSFVDVYLALSYNGGLKFDYYKINQDPVKLDTSNLLINSVSAEPVGSLAIKWTNLNNAKNLVTHGALVNDSLLAGYNKLGALMEILTEKSYGFDNRVKINLNCSQNVVITAVITKPLEPAFEKTVAKNLKFVKGHHTLPIDMRLLGLSKDNYILTLYYNNRNSFAWIIKE